MSERAIITGYALADMDERRKLEAEIERLRGLLARLKGTGDRLRDAANAALDMTKEWHGGLCSCRKCKVRDELGLSINAYDTQRAALGGLIVKEAE